MLYPAAVAAGVAARELVERGAQMEELLRDRTEDLAAERERVRVARELHDSLAKTVEGLSMSASTLPARCERDPMVAARVAQQLAEDARQAALEARSLMSGLRTPNSELPLAEAVRRRVQTFGDRSDVTVQLSCREEPAEAMGKVPPRVLHELLRILSEALANVARHSGASTVAVALEREGADVRLSVTDNGSGLGGPVNVEALKAAGHYGLAGMEERARAIGGALTIGEAPTGGTAIVLELPVDGEPAFSGEVSPEDDEGSHARMFRPGLIRRRSARVRA
jgi:signal transduction histidine kinase